MKKIIFGIFAHPDDEAFGPSGTMLMETRSGTELHLITLTAGDAGTNPDNHPDLGKIRLKEWKQAADLIGATSTHFLGYKDGHLDNLSMIEASDKIIEIVKKIVKDDKNLIIEFITSDLNGISGHIDHIVAARAACFVFYKLKESDSRFKRIRLSCVPIESMPSLDTSWLFMEPGRKPSEIGETIDAREFRDEIIQIMRAHYTQRGDGDGHISRRDKGIGINHFIVMT